MDWNNIAPWSFFSMFRFTYFVKRVNCIVKICIPYLEEVPERRLNHNVDIKRTKTECDVHIVKYKITDAPSLWHKHDVLWSMVNIPVPLEPRVSAGAK